MTNRAGGGEASPCKTGILEPREEGKDQVRLLPPQSPAIIDSDEKVLVFPVVELRTGAGAG